MHDESAFLRKLSETPSDDTIRLVYADWLIEQDDDESRAKARFLRLTVHLMGPIQRPGWRRPREQELKRLAADLPTDWLAVVSRLKVENCGAKRADVEGGEHTALQFDLVCDKRWDEMAPTSDPTVRLCDACQQNVHYCDTINEARKQAQYGHCVAVDLGIIRRGGDLEPPRMMLGRVSPGLLRQEEQRLEEDPVSRAREEQKRQQHTRTASESVPPNYCRASA
jgi:uncharacterized protein (TIGR02996 family)